MSQLEDRRSLDEAVWVFNAVVCNASVEILRREVQAFVDSNNMAAVAVTERPGEEEELVDDDDDDDDDLLIADKLSTRPSRVVPAKIGGRVTLRCNVRDPTGRSG